MARKKPPLPDPEFLGAISDPTVEIDLLRQMQDALVDVRPLTDEHFLYYVEAYYGMRLPTATGCPGHTPPGIVWPEIFFRRVGDVIVIGSRDSGKTWGFACVSHMQAGLDGIDIANIGAIQAQADKFWSYFSGFCNRPIFRHRMLKAPLMSRSEFKGFDHPVVVEIMPATVGRVNSPHPQIARWDEVELTDPKVLKEGASMPSRRGDFPPTVNYTSSRKKAWGPMETLLRDAKKKNLAVRTWCVFCVIETCPPERHQDGVGCRAGYCAACKEPRLVDGKDCPKCGGGLTRCPLSEDCLYAKSSIGGETVYEDGPGRAAQADGFKPIADVINQKLKMDKDTWDSQWLSKRPKQEGLVYPMFDRDRHVIPAGVYEWNPNLPVYAGQDFGFTAPGAVLYAQLLPTDELIVFAEDYTAGRITPNWARKIKAEPWFRNVKWVMADPAAKDQRETEIEAGIPVEQANNEREDGIARVRYLLDPPGRELPLLYFTENCVNAIAEAETYHHPDVKVDRNPDEDVQEIDDHAMDALRYMITELYGGQIKL